MSPSKNRFFAPALSALGASALILGALLASDVAQAQGAPSGRSAAGQAHRPSSAVRPTSTGAQIPQQAQDRVPQQAKDHAPPFGGSKPEGAQDGLAKAGEKAADQAKEHAPPLGGTLPEQAQDGLAKAGEKAAEQAKAVAPPLGGDPANAKPEEKPAQ